MSLETVFALFTVVMFGLNVWLWTAIKAILSEAKILLADAKEIADKWEQP